ncbi:CIC11C00000004688 [Sungouiella intermedia]|uniref:CIC11C00000004688 n=1 Tax=Sungouiella intermedia TaxID=45354 RepID=A0A1L0D4E6_9ASCO|nr:CIC11C00000004688 [[Candida] intermedia]
MLSQEQKTVHFSEFRGKKLPYFAISSPITDYEADELNEVIETLPYQRRVVRFMAFRGRLMPYYENWRRAITQQDCDELNHIIDKLTELREEKENHEVDKREDNYELAESEENDKERMDNINNATNECESISSVDLQESSSSCLSDSEDVDWYTDDGNEEIKYWILETVTQYAQLQLEPFKLIYFSEAEDKADSDATSMFEGSAMGSDLEESDGD